mgnify:CR=1 FL=1
MIATIFGFVLANNLSNLALKYSLYLMQERALKNRAFLAFDGPFICGDFKTLVPL